DEVLDRLLQVRQVAADAKRLGGRVCPDDQLPFLAGDGAHVLLVSRIRSFRSSRVISALFGSRRTVRRIICSRSVTVPSVDLTSCSMFVCSGRIRSASRQRLMRSFGRTSRFLMLCAYDPAMMPMLA